MSLATLSTRGPIATLTLNRPEQRNALSVELLADLHARVNELAALTASDAPRVLVLTGAGKAFCAGMDLKLVLGNRELSRALLRSLAELTFALRRLPMVTLALVNGPAIGGGCGLVTVCDLAITFADNKLGFPEVDLGVCPAVVAPWLVRKIGAGRARRVLLTGGLVSGTDAHALGIVSHLVASSDLLAEAGEALAQRLAQGGPHATAATKRLLNELDGSDNLELLLRAADLSADVLNTDATQAMLRAKLGV
jgi:methylglutaconyl-CoA hydratase